MYCYGYLKNTHKKTHFQYCMYVMFSKRMYFQFLCTCTYRTIMRALFFSVASYVAHLNRDIRRVRLFYVSCGYSKKQTLVFRCSQTQSYCMTLFFVVLIFFFLFLCGPGFRPFVTGVTTVDCPSVETTRPQSFATYFLYRRNKFAFCCSVIVIQSVFVVWNCLQLSASLNAPVPINAPRKSELANNNFFDELHKFSQEL